MAEDTDFGIDLWSTDDCLLGFNRVSGLTLVSQAVYRRLITIRGTVIDAPDYGFDVRGLLNKGMTTNQIASIPDQIKSEILKEKRIDTVIVIVNSATNSSISLTIFCTTAIGPFDLTISVTQAAAILISSNL